MRETDDFRALIETNLNENLLFTPLDVQANTGMIMTQPGNLSCKKIIHIVGQTDPVKINKHVKEVLRMCVANSFTSVSFPAIGTGELFQQNVLFIICADYFFYFYYPTYYKCMVELGFLVL